ncbi:MAG TPA: carbohydrate kinase [Natronosporangium sp.]
MAGFLVIGEALVDLLSEAGSWRFEAAPGGSPLNVAVGLAAAGHRVRLACELGDDLFGELIRGHLDRYGVDPADLLTTDAPTNLAFARLDAAGVASYDFRLGWRWGGRPDLTGVRCLHIGSLGAVLAPGDAAVRRVVADAHRRGVPVSYDPNVRPALIGDGARPAIEALVAAADLVKLSADDLAWLRPGEPIAEVAAGWLRRGRPRLVVVTRGAAGAVGFTRTGRYECPAPPVEVVDTVGAGDAFTAGLLSSLDRAGGLAPVLAEPDPAAIEAAIQEAVAVAAATCRHRGAAPPAPEVVDRLRAAISGRFELFE